MYTRRQFVIETLGCKLAKKVLLRAFEVELRETFQDGFNKYKPFEYVTPFPVLRVECSDDIAQFAKRRRSYIGHFHLYRNGELG